MVHGPEASGEAVFDLVEFAEGQFAVVELAVLEASFDDLVDLVFDAADGGFGEGSGRTFGGVGEHEDGAFTAVGFGAGVAEFDVGDGLLAGFASLLVGEAVEVFDEGRAVMLGDELVEDLWDAVLFGQFEAVLDVSDDDEQAHGGREALVPGEVPGGLVFDEVFGFGELSDVVIEGSDAGEEAVGSDGLGGGFGHVADEEAVVEGARDFEGEPPHEGFAGVAPFQEGHAGGDLEEAFDAGQDTLEHEDGDEGGGSGPDGVDQSVADLLVGDQLVAPVDGEAHHGGGTGDFDQLGSASDLVEDHGDGHAAGEEGEEEAEVAAHGEDQKGGQGHGDHQGETLVVGDGHDEGDQHHMEDGVVFVESGQTQDSSEGDGDEHDGGEGGASGPVHGGPRLPFDAVDSDDEGDDGDEGDDTGVGENLGSGAERLPVGVVLGFEDGQIAAGDHLLGRHEDLAGLVAAVAVFLGVVVDLSLFFGFIDVEEPDGLCAFLEEVGEVSSDGGGHGSREGGHGPLEQFGDLILAVGEGPSSGFLSRSGGWVHQDDGSDLLVFFGHPFNDVGGGQGGAQLLEVLLEFLEGVAFNEEGLESLEGGFVDAPSGVEGLSFVLIEVGVEFGGAQVVVESGQVTFDLSEEALVEAVVVWGGFLSFASGPFGGLLVEDAERLTDADFLPGSLALAPRHDLAAGDDDEAGGDDEQQSDEDGVGWDSETGPSFGRSGPDARRPPLSRVHAFGFPAEKHRHINYKISDDLPRPFPAVRVGRAVARGRKGRIQPSCIHNKSYY